MSAYCDKCKHANQAYRELYWLVLFKGTQGRDATLKIKETTGRAIYAQKGHSHFIQRCQITNIKAQAPSGSAQVKWTINTQDDTLGTRTCDSARVIIHVEYWTPTDIPTARLILESLQVLWDHTCRTQTQGQAYLQHKGDDVIEYRIIIVIGNYEPYQGRYKTLAWT